jgi:arylsulfatase A-like enzyme
MKKTVTRRDFLKIAGLLPVSFAAPRLMSSLQAEGQKNVIVVVFDAFSASNISLYGYQRETTPNLARLAERAVVYHNHYAGGNFTTPGTASLLTGTLPWTNRAIKYFNKVEKSFIEKNIFSAFQDHYRLAYTHNPVANVFLKQFQDKIDDHIPLGRLFLSNDDMINAMFEKDEDIATVSWVRAMKKREEGYSYSLFLSHLYEAYRESQIANVREQFPSGLPHIATDNYYILEDAINWLRDNLGAVPKPFMGYFHLLPPHTPYKTHRDFSGRFKNDGWEPVSKPFNWIFGKDGLEEEFRKRTWYDEFILYVDREFARLFNYLEDSGLLEDTWVVLTSDHGEMFERGIIGHGSPVMYEPVVRIPLMIFEPGRKERIDIHTPTSAIDLLPTITHVAGQPGPEWTEGLVMPPYASKDPGEDRSIYIVEASRNEQFNPMNIATTTIVKGGYKLTRFTGYKQMGGEERIELYDVENDPEELNDLYSTKRETASELLHELQQKQNEADKPYL